MTDTLNATRELLSATRALRGSALARLPDLEIDAVLQHAELVAYPLGFAESLTLSSLEDGFLVVASGMVRQIGDSVDASLLIGPGNLLDLTLLKSEGVREIRASAASASLIHIPLVAVLNPALWRQANAPVAEAPDSPVLAAPELARRPVESDGEKVPFPFVSGEDSLAACMAMIAQYRDITLEYADAARVRLPMFRVEHMARRNGLVTKRLLLPPQALPMAELPLMLDVGKRFILLYGIEPGEAPVTETEPAQQPDNPAPPAAISTEAALVDLTPNPATVEEISAPPQAEENLLINAWVTVANPARPDLGVHKMRYSDLLAAWQGIAWEIRLKDTSDKFGLSWFIPSVLRYRSTLIQVLAGSIVLQLLGLGTPMLTQVVIDKVMVHGGMQTLTVVGTGMLLIAIFETVLGMSRTYLMTHTANRIDLILSGKVFQHLMALPQGYFDLRRVGDTVARLREMHTIREFITGTAMTVVLDALFTVIYIVVMLLYSPILTLVVVGMLPFYAILTIIATPHIRNRLNEAFNRNSDSQSFLVESLAGMQGVKAHSAEIPSIRRWEGLYARYVQAGFKASNANNIAGHLAQGMTALTTLLILWVGAYQVIEQALTIGGLIAFQMLAGHVTGPLIRLIQLWQNMQQVLLGVDRIGDILNTPPEREPGTGLQPERIRGEIAFDKLGFSYFEGQPRVLDDVSFTIQPGQFVCAVGKTGSGKSTLSKLIQSLYLPNTGAVLVDGMDTRNIDPASLRTHIACVLQDDFLFNSTVFENIAFGKEHVSTEAVVRAAMLADAHEFITKLPYGYDTVIGERGLSLSGGQRQRLALARVFLSDAPVVILDEATSALDAETEHKIIQNLRRSLGKRTVFMITHRFAPTVLADVILVLDQGRLVEYGSHRDLLLRRGTYAALHDKQKTNF